MKFLCLVYGCDGPDSNESDMLRNPVVRDVIDHRERLRQNGSLIASAPLESVSGAVTVRVRNGHSSVTDGPFAETKEHVGGFYLIEAVGLDEAVELAKTMPPARTGAIEVRAVNDYAPE